MAPGYGQYNNYYDPVGSQANQPQPYSYQTAATSASQPATASYSAPSYSSYGSSAYSTQQHGASTCGQDTQPPANRSASAQQHDGGSASWGNPNYTSSSYGASLQPPARSQSNNSPLYASNAPSTSYGRMSYNTPSSQAQSSATTYGQPAYAQQSSAQSYATTGTSDTSRQAYSASQYSQAPTDPSRYATSLQPVQAQATSHHQPHQQSHQQTHARPPSRSSTQQSSPVMTRAPPHQADHRQASASVEPSNTTVDPSQVYDFRAERERKAKIEADKRRKMEEVETARKAEEACVAEEQRKVDEAIRKAEEQKANKERRRAEQARRKMEDQAAASKAAAKLEEKRKKEEQRKARESKNAATTLAAMASSSNVPDSNDLLPPANDDEAEMRAMFQKMREFNSKNPAMLAKLWEEERRSHAVQSQSPQPSPTLQATAQPPKPKSSASQQSSSAVQVSGTASTPNQAKSAQKATSSGTTPAGPANQGQGSEANTSQGTTHLWPPGKKGLLAEIAARWLQNVNPHQSVMTSEVLKRLDMNPNYVQLCESLEVMGLKFERAAFARELLRGIPPGNNSSQHLTKVSDATIMSANGTLAQATGVAQPDETNPKKRRATKAEMEQRRALNLVKNMNKQNSGSGSSNGMVEYQMPSFTVPGDAPNGGSYLAHMREQVQASASPFQPHQASPTFPTSNNHSRQPSQSVQPDRQSISVAQQGRPMPVESAQQTPEVKQMSPPRQPANKEEAARKRGFADLVDLTAGDSDDDAPPAKIMKPSQLQRPSEQQNNQPQQQQQQNQKQAQQPPYQYKPKPANPEALVGKFRMQPFVPKPGVPPTTPQFYMQPNGSFGTAPPAPMAAANASASGVPTPKPSHKKKVPTNEMLQHERIKGKMVVEPIMRDRVARRSTYDSRTIARDILLATGRHPDMRPLNSHMNVMQKLLGERGGQLDLSGNKSDLATIKWDILDPDPPKKIVPVKELSKPSVVRSTELDGEDADDEEDEVRLAQPEASKADHVQSLIQRDNPKPALDVRNANTSNGDDNKPKPKRRGRPPRSSLPNFQTDTTKNSPMSATATPRQASRKPESTPATAPAGRATASNAPTGTPVGYAAFQKYDANGNPIKTKGRPVGWRKDVHSRAAQGLPPKQPGSSSTKLKTSASRPERQLQEPKYHVYKCRWSECDAELHSLDNLKKHVLKVHGKSDEENQYLCLWRGCADKDDTFEDIPTWLGHVDKEHLQPVAWQLGDGPRGGLSGKSFVQIFEV